jgi:hypothetical protein
VLAESFWVTDGVAGSTDASLFWMSDMPSTLRATADIEAGVAHPGSAE